MATRQPISDFQKIKRAELERRAQAQAGAAGTVEQDKQARRANTNLAMQHIGPGAASMTQREIARAYNDKDGDVAGALKYTAQKQVLDQSQLGMYKGATRPDGSPDFNNWDVNNSVDDRARPRLLSMDNRTLDKDQRTAYSNLQRDTTEASRQNVPLSMLETRRAQILGQQNTAATLGAPAREADAKYMTAEADDFLNMARGKEIIELMENRRGLIDSESNSNNADAGFTEQRGNDLAALIKLRQDRSEKDPARFSYDGQTPIPQPAPVPPVDPRIEAEAALTRAQTDEIRAKLNTQGLTMFQRAEFLKTLANPSNEDKELVKLAQAELDKLVRQTQGGQSEVAAPSPDVPSWQRPGAGPVNVAERRGKDPRNGRVVILQANGQAVYADDGSPVPPMPASGS
jgi:hypothetical protein